jgi:uncharacterized protein
MNQLLINLRHLVGKDLQVKGEIDTNELSLNELDEMIHVSEPVRYELEIQQMDDGLLVTGRVSARLQCECVRCLKPFTLAVDLSPFAIQLPLKGEDAVPVSGDFVDLTPYLREDIVLAFPQHPLCDPGCAGLEKKALPAMDAQSGHESQVTSSAWAALNDLKL